MSHPFNITPGQWRCLLANGQIAEADPDFDARPVVKLVKPDGHVMFLVAEVKPGREDMGFGLMHYGTKPMLRFIDFPGVAADEFGRDLQAQPYLSDLTLTEAALKGLEDGKIIDYAATPCPLCSPQDFDCF